MDQYLVRSDVDADDMARLGPEAEPACRAADGAAAGLQLHQPALAQQLCREVLGGRPGHPDQPGELRHGDLVAFPQHP